ncbi:MAG: hypothetical protein JOY60_10020 [Burkholderiaceae bacterium]|nr:hypothetical protein [Roseateles sp.]MBV8470178.1 hypothetical protein [Burkholderiaceae bacterium]
MIIPLPLVPRDAKREPQAQSDAQEPLSFDQIDPSIRVRRTEDVPLEPLDLGQLVIASLEGHDLQAFSSLMARERLPLQPARMLYDRVYAFERLAQAHASNAPDLQDLAGQIFDNYQARGEWIGMIH